jgi:hypothetical protein
MSILERSQLAAYLMNRGIDQNNNQMFDAGFELQSALILEAAEHTNIHVTVGSN